MDAQEWNERRNDGRPGERESPVRAVVDGTIAALLCTRICHDLAGPIGAMAAGSELLAEGDDEFVREASSLLMSSSSGAATRLKFLRAAFGSVSAQRSEAGDWGEGVWHEARAGIDAYVRALFGTAVTVSWAIDDQRGNGSSGDVVKIVFNLVLSALEAVHGGGQVSVTGNGTALTVTATGAKVSLSDAERRALAGDRTVVTARTVQGFYLASLVTTYGGVDVVEDDGHISFVVSGLLLG